MAKWFACVNIAQMDLDHRRLDGCKSIPQCNRIMRKCSRIDNNAICIISMGLKVIDQGPFVVRLEILYAYSSQIFSTLLQHFINLGQGCCTINSGFASAQCIEIWSMHHQNFQDGSPAKNAVTTRCTSSPGMEVIATSPMRRGITQCTCLSATFLSSCIAARISRADTEPEQAIGNPKARRRSH